MSRKYSGQGLAYCATKGHFHINFHAGAAPSNDENLVIGPAYIM